MYWYHDQMGWWGYAGMGLGAMLLCALVILGIIVFAKYLAGERNAVPIEAPSAEGILACRFARGEIAETEYRERLSVLRSDAHR